MDIKVVEKEFRKYDIFLDCFLCVLSVLNSNKSLDNKLLKMNFEYLKT